MTEWSFLDELSLYIYVIQQKRNEKTENALTICSVVEVA